MPGTEPRRNSERGGVPRVSYARHQEDILLDRVFRGQATGTYVDVGANHPMLHSNTYFFYQRGWRGINIEPLRQHCALFHRHRPGDTTLAAAVSDREGARPFYEIPVNSELSTLSAIEAERIRAEGHEVVEYEVPVRSLRSIIAEHRIPPPDFLSIDVERYEERVIRGMPLDVWRPGVLIVESFADQSYRAWERTLLDRGYLFAHYNGVNRFYLRDDLRDRLDCLRTPPVDFLDDYEVYALVASRERNWALAAQYAETAGYARRLEARVAQLEAAYAETADYARGLESKLAETVGRAGVFAAGLRRLRRRGR